MQAFGQNPSPNILNFSSPATGAKTFSFNLNQSSTWQIYAQPWITVSLTSGTGPATITVTVADNDSQEDSRTDDITIIVTLNSNTSFYYVQINQEKHIPSVITLSTNALNVISDADRNTLSNLTVNSNVDWTATADSWITLNSTSGTSGNSSLQITSKPNPNFTPRSGTVTFTGIEVSQTLTINQEASVPFIKVYKNDFGNFTELPTDTLKFTYQGEQKSVGITNNFQFIFSVSDRSWITIGESSTLGNLNNFEDLSSVFIKNLLSITPSQNSTNAQRVSVITVSDVSSTIPLTKKMVINRV